ncbi:hypothetical protein K435DRAFT_82351 [Dendrothele bispora CBS 962.96]|uniref:Uncharacterized protein n=1 Tax=Dendrothele bispora (strain CBS 962.96) TaxID=1314807 RepID=A0A4S8M3X8_DENBC|nr:hypothetical protein K435DRAFT_82351 [Dendrothele bispora CBS 962.96]
MLRANGIECWIGRYRDPSDEIHHGDSATRVEDGVTTVQTTIALRPNPSSVALSQWQICWRKTDDAEPQSLWCTVKWTTPTGKERDILQVWMSRSMPETQSHSSRAQAKSMPMPSVRAIPSSKDMGSVRLELQRIRGDVKVNNVNDVDYVLEDTPGPFCVFIFQFEKNSGALSLVGKTSTGSREVSEVSNGSKVVKRPRMSRELAGLFDESRNTPTQRLGRNQRIECQVSNRPLKKSRISQVAGPSNSSGLDNPSPPSSPSNNDPLDLLSSEPSPTSAAHVVAHVLTQNQPGRISSISPSSVPRRVPAGPLQSNSPPPSTFDPASAPDIHEAHSKETNFVPRELQQAESFLREQEQEQKELDEQLANLDKVRVERLKQEIKNLKADNEAKRQWLQTIKNL